MRIASGSVFMLLLCALTIAAARAQVSSHQKISDTEGNFSGVLDDADSFGISLANLGDLDGDGVADLAVGTVFDDDGGIDRGAVWILFLNADGTVRSHQKLSDTEGGFDGILDNEDRFGFSVASLGDLDGDDVVDLAVGAHLDDDGGDRKGAVWVVFLNVDGTVKSHQKISDTEGRFDGVISSGDELGISVASLGDLDGDGVTDLVAGALGDDDGGDRRGAVWVLFLNADGTIKSHQKISDTEGGFDGILDNGDRFGRSVATLGDLNADGVTDLAVGAVFDDDGGLDRGAVWVLFLNANGTVKSHQKISGTQGGFDGSLDDEDQFVVVANLGDLDGDEITDLAVGAFGDDDGGTDRGAIWVLFLNPDGTVKSHQKISNTGGGFGGSLDNGDRFGVSVVSLGALNGNGGVALAVGADLDDDGGNFDHGAIWVLFTEYPVLTSVEHVDTDFPSAYQLAANFPNPFNPSTTIPFDVPRAGHVTLKVYDVIGREVATLVDQVLSGGTYHVTWNADNASGGLYLYHLQVGAFSQARKMTLIR